MRFLHIFWFIHVGWTIFLNSIASLDGPTWLSALALGWSLAAEQGQEPVAYRDRQRQKRLYDLWVIIRHIFNYVGYIGLNVTITVYTELERMRQEAPLPTLRYYLSVYLGRLRKTIKSSAKTRPRLEPGTSTIRSRSNNYSIVTFCGQEWDRSYF
jgi:hypothetical protein